ncbi:alpha-1,4-glucan--maltose-1-phosphate maltosyltransferase [Polluticoccus soli]|uniref:alpha-1,4-glucan--maltose-1-phosphate maltosyltransferase n=1 Tax=Polluticoccus soli TaxID=3034150 RepID=UPI0023E1E1E2|nr:alpha-1,4-glucan--maltose-1-phosphate maltosyltransferase [Flavipsychrobacter sp. JY13-12]
MLAATGKKRVVIIDVSPQIENGKYPAKAVIDEPVVISANIFGDGHDEIGVSVMIKAKGDRVWKEFPMRLINNDHWEFSFVPPKLGFYQFQVLAWIDHFATWKKGLLKKIAAGQDVMLELEIGANIISEAEKKAKGKEKTLLVNWEEAIKASNSHDAVELVARHSVEEIMRHFRSKETTTVFPQILDIEVERKKAGFSAWYELFPRSTAKEPGKHGTFKDVEQLLPRIAKMGFDTLYFPPIHPIGEEKRKGRNNALTAKPDDPGSPWAIGSKLGGHKTIHPELGTVKELKALIKAAKKFDIEIAMDIAFQCAPDHPYVTLHPQWFKWRPDGTVQYAENPPKKYEDILPFNFETDDWENLWQELKSVFDFWIENGINVFRVDNPHTKSLSFWEWVIPAIRKESPDIIFLAEAFTRPRVMERLAKAGFNQSYTYFTWRESKKELEEYMTELTKTDKRYYFRPNFWPNTPDILPPHLTHGGENAHILRLLLAATLSSNYGLYGPVYEYGMTTPMPGKEEYIDNEKYEVKHWNWEEYTRIREIITRINGIRKENPALHSTWNIELAETTSEQIICYGKRDMSTGNTLLIAVNLDPHNTHSAMVKVPLEKLNIPTDRAYNVSDLLSGDSYQWQGEWNYVELNPYEMPAHVFKVDYN